MDAGLVEQPNRPSRPSRVSEQEADPPFGEILAHLAREGLLARAARVPSLGLVFGLGRHARRVGEAGSARAPWRNRRRDVIETYVAAEPPRAFGGLVLHWLFLDPPKFRATSYSTAGSWRKKVF